MTANTEPTGNSQPLGEPAPSRRQYLRALAGGGAAVGALTASSEPVAASEAHADAKPNHVTISDDSEFLNRYRPYLDLAAVPHTNHPTLYGWKFTSSDADVETDVGVFAAEYGVQKDFLSLTSHVGDHEWVYVFVDASTGEVTEVSYTAYHWLRGYVTNPPTFDGDHVALTVAPTYHNYVPASEVTSSAVLLDPESLGDYSTTSGPFYRWLQNGMAEDLEPGAVHNPWTLDSDGPLDAWWSREGSGRVNRTIVGTWAFIAFSVGVGIRGGDEADLGEADL